MPNKTVNTGLGGTIIFETIDPVSPIATLNWTTITPGDSTITDIDLSQLATPTNRQYMPGDLIEDNVITIEFQFDSARVAEMTAKQQYTATIFWPLASTENTPAMLKGTGYINSMTRSQLAIDELQMGTIVFKFDGGARGGMAPVFTPATQK